jgi:hypothetical protein
MVTGFISIIYLHFTRFTQQPSRRGGPVSILKLVTIYISIIPDQLIILIYLSLYLSPIELSPAGKAVRYNRGKIAELVEETFTLEDVVSELDTRVHAHNQPFLAPRAEVLGRWEGVREQRRIQWGLDDADTEAYEVEALGAIRHYHQGRLDRVMVAQGDLDLPPDVFEFDRERILGDLARELADHRQARQTEIRILAEEREFISGSDQAAMEVELRGVSEGMLAPLCHLQARNAFMMYKNNPIMLRYYFLY